MLGQRLFRIVITPALLASCFAAAQPQPPVFRSERDEVQVVVVVRDGSGHAIAGLKQGDFQVLDNGKPQVIHSFAVQQATLTAEQARAAGAQVSQEPGAAPVQTAPAQRRFIALFFDDVNTTAGDFMSVKKAASAFIQESLRPEDRVAIFKTSGNTEIAFTNDRAKLLAAINALQYQVHGYHAENSSCPRITSYEAYAVHEATDTEALEVLMKRVGRCFPGFTPEQQRNAAQTAAEAAWNEVRAASGQVLAEVDATVRTLVAMPGPRMLVLASSGFISRSLERDTGRTIDIALRSGIVINALSSKGLTAAAPYILENGQPDTDAQARPGGRSDGSFQLSEPRYLRTEAFIRANAEQEAMIDLTTSTGGRFFKNNNDLRAGFDELNNVEIAYVLAFSPEPLKHDGKFHKLKVEIKAPGTFSVQARQGYFAPTEKEFEAAAHRPALPSQPLIAAQAPKAAPAADFPPPSAAHSGPAAAMSAEPQTQADSRLEWATSRLAAAKPPAFSESTRDFLQRASNEVEYYIMRFADLTADEAREMETFDAAGHSRLKRTMRSAVVVYRLRSEPWLVIEFRDVTALDGKEIKGHSERAAKMWTEIAKARNAQEEVKLIRLDSERYDIGLQATGFTLYEGLPLRQQCAGAFVFAEAAPEQENARTLRVFNYAQTKPCEVITYHFELPRQYAEAKIVHTGQLRIDAETAQIVREERSVYLGDFKGPRAAHVVLGYTASAFGLLLPKVITIELFGIPDQSLNATYTPSTTRATHSGAAVIGPAPTSLPEALASANFVLRARMVQTYGAFTRFEVSTAEKVSGPH